MALGATLSELGERMSSAEVTAWMAYNRVDPFGEQRGDIRNAMSLKQFADAHRDRKMQSEPFNLKDFMPFLIEPPKKALSAQQVKAKWLSLFKRD